MNLIRVSYPVPYYAQVASPELAGPIFREEMDARDDPRWAETGARDADEYAYWVMRACGIVSMKTCIEALGGPQRTVMAWIEDGLARDAYRIRHDDQGNPFEVGWIHDGLIGMMRDCGLSAVRQTGTVEDIQAAIQADRLVIASVTYELGSSLPVTRNWGHLVVVHGYQTSDERLLTGLLVNNPSGRAPAFQQDALIPIERFREGFSGRMMVVWRNFPFEEPA